MLSSLKARIRDDVRPIGSALAAIGLTPNAVTLIGLLLHLVVAGVVATGQLTLGGILLLPVAAFDMLDGAVARATNRTTTFGAFLDSTLDRYEEGAMMIALLVVYGPRGDAFSDVAIFACMLGSFMVSYTRARAEGLGLRCEVGLVPRPERIVILAVGLIVGWVMPAVWLLAILSNLTALQRIWHVRRVTSGLNEEGRRKR